MLVVALTGGIGSGKSTVSQLFETFGTPIIDTDIIARQLVAPGEPALDEITKQFGPIILSTDGSLDRAKLRQIIFQNAEKKAQLESILHPLIRKEVAYQVSALTAPYCIVVIPLLIESNQEGIANRILVVDTPESAQLARVTRRDNQTENEVSAIISAQASRHERLAAADEVIHNDGSLEELKQQIAVLHQKYLGYSQAS
ncbi:Dephospho-CoA kinase [hydrothermal vent metagenome]|uniref:Dephospho-CoA kinase n=1 Tax=hydrothermal vent metagenome TaxID=652676 RepID=A0A3B0ZX06_9ZZZZ